MVKGWLEYLPTNHYFLCNEFGSLEFEHEQLVLSWNTGFDLMCIAACLSQNKDIGWCVWNPKSLKCPLSHINSHGVDAMA